MRPLRANLPQVDDDRFEIRDVILALVSNALAEAQAGHCTTIDVELLVGVVRVTDDGRGLPTHPHPQSGRSLVEVIFTGPRRGPRNTLAQITGSCLWVDVEIHRDGELWFQRFEYGQPTTELERRGSAVRRGSTITCAPVAGQAPTFEELLDYLRSLTGEVVGSPVKIRVRDSRQDAREETIVLG